jgi:hypothetical protein
MVVCRAPALRRLAGSVRRPEDELAAEPETTCCAERHLLIWIFKAVFTLVGDEPFEFSFLTQGSSVGRF